MKKSKPSWINNIKLIAWDLDGTLYPPSQEMNNFVYQKIIDSISNKIKISNSEAEKRYKQKYSQLHSTTKTLNSFDIDGKQFFLNIWGQHDLSPYIKPNDALRSAFAKLAASDKYILYLHTNSNTQETVEKKLQLVGLKTSLFNKIITSVDVGYNKPDKRMFSVLLDDSGAKASEILYVGDRKRTDIIPAREMGMRTAQVVTDTQIGPVFKDKPNEITADIIIKNPKELIESYLL